VIKYTQLQVKTLVTVKSLLACNFKHDARGQAGGVACYTGKFIKHQASLARFAPNSLNKKKAKTEGCAYFKTQ